MNKNLIKNQNRNITNKDQEDEDEDIDKYLGYFEQQQSFSSVVVYLDERIMSSKYYRQVLNRLENLNEGDFVEIKVNTYGGNLDGALSLIHAIRSTKADVHCSIEGVAASAGSLIALSCPSIGVAPHSTMMIHSAFGGSGGILGNLANHANFINEHTKSVMKDVYDGFLSQQELEEVFLGRELWFTADEICERLEAKSKKIEEGNTEGKQVKQGKEQDLVADLEEFLGEGKSEGSDTKPVKTKNKKV